MSKKIKTEQEGCHGNLHSGALKHEGVYYREPLSQHPAAPQPGILVKAPLLSLDRGTKEQLINKMQILHKNIQAVTEATLGVAGLKAEHHTPILPCVRSEVLALPLLFFVYGNC